MDDKSSVQYPSLLKRIGIFVGITLAFLLLTGTLVSVLGFIMPELPDVFGDANLRIYLYNWLIFLLSVLIAIWTTDYLQEKRGWPGLGFSAHGSVHGIIIGAAVALLILTICFLILLAGGWAQIVAYQFAVPPFLGWLLFFLIQPLAEEVVMRSFLQNQLHYLFGPWVGLFGAALIFAALHIGNNAFTCIAGLEIVAGGLLMGLLFLYTQNIWAAYAMHATWNFYQSIVLGFAVSGMDTYRVLRLETEGPAWLTGGEFGLEGSILSLILSAVAIVIFWPATHQKTPLMAHSPQKQDL